MGSDPVGASEFYLGFICKCLSYFITAKISLSFVVLTTGSFFPSLAGDVVDGTTYIPGGGGGLLVEPIVVSECCSVCCVLVLCRTEKLDVHSQ